MNTLYAVIWLDFIPLTLACESAQAAINAAQCMAEKGPHIDYIRAVELTPDNKIITLWEKESEND